MNILSCKSLKFILSVLVIAIFTSCGEEKDDGLILGDTFVSDGIVYMKLSDDPKEAGVEGLEVSKEWLTIPAKVTNRDVKYRVTRINNEAFYGDTSIVAVDLPPTINRIGSGAFSHCGVLKQVVLFGTDVDICDGAFEYSAIEKITIPKGCRLGIQVFNNCRALSECILPCDLKIIPEYCFYQCHSLENMEIPHSVEYIAGTAFFQTGVNTDFTGWK